MKRLPFTVHRSLIILFVYCLWVCIPSGLSTFSFSQNLPGTCSIQKNFVQPMNGNGKLGATYSKTDCGLNYVYDSAHIETRFFNATNTLKGCGGSCSWNIVGLPAGFVVDKAFVWALCSYVSASPPSGSVTITNPAANTSTYPPATGTAIGTATSKCWGETGSCTYRYDVTPSISGNGNYSFTFPGFTGTPFGTYFLKPYDQIDGATLMIIYKDPTATYQGTMNIWDGAIEQSGPASTSTMTGLNVNGKPSSARAFTISSDHQPNISPPTHQTTLNNVAGTYPNLFYNEDETPVTLTCGQTTCAFGMDGSSGSDCYLWGVMGLYYQLASCNALSVTATPTSSTCGFSNGSAALSVSGGVPPYTYLWSTGATTSTINNLAAGNYSVSVSSPAGCVPVSVAFTVIGIPALPIIAGTNSTLCAGGSITLSASGAATYTWSPTSGLNNSSISNPVASPSITTTYTVSGTDTSGCIGSAAVTVTIFPLQTVSVSGNNTICAGSLTTLTASGGSNYTWSTGTTATSIIVSPTTTITYSASVIPNNSCATSGTITVNVLAIPAISISGNSTICAGNAALLTASGGTTYSWNTGATTSFISVFPTVNTSYTVFGFNSQCSASSIFSINITQPPAVNVSSGTSICLGSSTTLNVFSNPSGVGYSWFPSSGLSCDTCPSTIATPGFSNTYTVYVTDIYGCIASATVPITVGAIPVLSAIASPTVCTGGTAQLMAGLGNVPPSQMPVHWSWFPPNSPPLSSDTAQNPTITPNTTTNLYVVVTDAYGCKDTAFATVYVQTIPSVSWTKWTPYITCDGYVVPFMANVSTNGGSVYWSFGDNSHYTDYQPAPGNMLWTSAPSPHIYQFGSTYNVSVVAINSICRDTIDTTFTITDMGNYLNVLPANVFTPNGDGKNDCFHPAINLINIPSITSPEDLGNTISQCIELEVFDRWGIKMFETTDNVKCWDGKTKGGSPAKEGTYYYVAKFKDATIKGFVELMR